ncbi:pyridoxamine 5'-phosphate oxidase family protein [Nesterenkonia sp. NBAIMH1]|uniref:pyridoxamine 5'-phosphate oxidase family protein n=1 Tax=Nesterenkonia sp. NBAIMH1 TaxID=2600320 RepID=UPI0011B7F5AD|nr:pyridoxamine 5'-phosphate oxidase family protein [Nesterenkonia sp. NBAIMH1]
MRNSSSASKTEILDGRECWELLRAESLGRLAVCPDGRPEIFPVTYLTERESVVFRTGPGTKLTAAMSDAPVAFETDGIDTARNTAWSVVVKGTAIALEHTDEFKDSPAYRLRAWQAGPKDHFVRIVPDEVTGRRFTIGAPHAWDLSLKDATRSGLE